MAGWLERAAQAVASKTSDVWDRGVDVVNGPVQAARSVADGFGDLASAPFTHDEYQGLLGTIYGVATHRGAQALGDVVGPTTGLGALAGGLPSVIRNPGGTVLHDVVATDDRVYKDVVSRPLSAAATTGSLADAPGGGGVLGLLDTANWRKAWDIAQTRSPGQAIALAMGTKNINDPQEVQRFMATDHYRQWSGIADAVIHTDLDPLVVAGKLKSGLSAGLTAVPDSQSAIVAARDSTRVAKFVDRVDTIVAEKGDGAAARIRSELFPNHPQGAYLSDLLANAPDTLTRRRIIGSAMGSYDDLAALTAEQPAIAHQVKALTSDALDAIEREKGTAGPGRAELLDGEIRALYPQVDEFKKVQATYQTLQDIPSRSFGAQARAAISGSDMFQHSPLTAPVRVLTNMLPSHWLNLNDTGSDIQIQRMLDQSPLAAEDKAALRGQYMSQVDPAGRQRAAIAIEETMTKAILEKHGMPLEVVQDVLNNARNLRSESTGILKDRMYDAAGRGEQHVAIEQADGTVAHIRVPTPLHSTQQADLLPLADPQAIEHAARAAKSIYWDSTVFDGLRNDLNAARLRQSGSAIANTALGAAPNALEHVMDGFYSVWRPATLLRAGWPARILMDEQLRIMSKIGALAQIKTLASGAVNDVRDRLTPWEVTMPDGEVLSGRGLPGVTEAMPEQIAQGVVHRGIGDYETTILTRNGPTVQLPPAFGNPGDAANVYKQLASIDSSFRALAVPTEDGLLKELRQTTGAWHDIGPRDRAVYPGMWESAVNKQIAQSAFAREALAGKSVDELAGWLGRTDDGLAYARQMGWSPRTFGDHAFDVYDQVHRYVPTEGLRAKLLDGPLSHADLQSVVSEDLRPRVHAPDLATALGKDQPITDFLRSTRDRLFNTLGKLPTDTLSRHPLFDAMYRSEGERLVNQATDAAANGGPALNDAVLQDIASKSREFALGQVKNSLHNLTEKSELAHMLRFAAPFYSAWQQVLTRWAGLAVDNPAFAARMRLAFVAPEKAGIVTDENGNRIDADGKAHDPFTDAAVAAGSDRYITLPFGIPGLPTHGSVAFNRKSLNLALSGSPGVGPPVQVAVNELVKHKPDLEQSVKWALPYGTVQNSATLVLPADAKRAFTVAQKEDDRQFANSLLRIYFDRMTDYRLGKRAAPPTYDEAKKAASDLASLRTVASWVLPFAPTFKSPYQPYIDAYRNAQDRLRQDPTALGTHEDGTGVTADEWFLDTHGPEFFYLTQSLSKTNDGVPPTPEGFDARNRYKDLIEKHPDLGGVIIGNEGAGDYSGGVYDYQLSTPIKPGSGTRQRSTYSFEEGSQQPDVRLGWIEYGRAMDIIDAERVRRGLPNLSINAAADLAAVKKGVTDALSAKYPAWATQFAQQNTLKWDQRIASFRDVAQDPKLDRPDRPDIAGIRDYLEARDVFSAELQRRPAHTISAASNADLADAWESVKAAIVEKDVAFAPIFYRFLERDPLTPIKVGAGG